LSLDKILKGAKGDSLQTGNDGFTYSDHFAEDALPDAADFEHVPVDPENPGFASLLPAIQGCRRGDYPLAVLQGYVAGLAPRIGDTYAQLDKLQEQLVKNTGFAEDQMEQLLAAAGATEAALGEMNTVLELCERCIEFNDMDLLEEAESRLTLVHTELKQVL